MQWSVGAVLCFPYHVLYRVYIFNLIYFLLIVFKFKFLYYDILCIIMCDI